MITDGLLARARALQESMFSDQLVLESEVIVKTQFKDTTERVSQWSGLGLVQPSAGSRDPVLVGGQLVQTQTFKGKFQANVPVERGWILRVVTSRDENLVGRELRVREILSSSLATCTYVALEAI